MGDEVELTILKGSQSLYSLVRMIHYSMDKNVTQKDLKYLAWKEGKYLGAYCRAKLCSEKDDATTIVLIGGVKLATANTIVFEAYTEDDDLLNEEEFLLEMDFFTMKSYNQEEVVEDLLMKFLETLNLCLKVNLTW